jgi:XTP/dITP diphosphohydrolase
VTNPPLKIVVASANAPKATEIVAILEPLVGDRIVILPRPIEIGEIEETGTTLEQNAELKARAVAEATGLAALADDTGLEVDALGGAPGVYSARYAGKDASDEENIAKLLGELKGRIDRAARFRTVVVLAFPDGRILSASGTAEGWIGEIARGGSGFGYDPIFVPAGGTRSFAELAGEEKDAVSHRGAAIRSLAPLLFSELA